MNEDEFELWAGFQSRCSWFLKQHALIQLLTLALSGSQLLTNERHKDRIIEHGGICQQNDVRTWAKPLRY